LLYPQAESEGLKKQLQKIQVEKAEVEKELSKITEKLDEMQEQAIQAKTEQLKASLKEEIDGEMIEVDSNENSITIRIRDRGSFPPGTATITEDFIAEELVKTSGDIIVAGHTDDIPINTARFRSNWALSSARSVAVTHEFINENKMDKTRFSIQAFADSKPLVENDTTENRAINRRVEIIISQSKMDLGLKLGEQQTNEKPEIIDSEDIQKPVNSQQSTKKSTNKSTKPKKDKLSAAKQPKPEQNVLIPEPVKQINENEAFNSDSGNINNEAPPEEEPPSFIQF